MPVADPVASSGLWRPWCTGLTASPQPAVKSAAARSAGTAANVVRLSMISPVVECAPRWVTPRVAHHEWQGSGQRATARRAGSTPRLHRTAASDRAGPPSFPAHPLSLKRPLTDNSMRSWPILLALNLAAPLAAQQSIEWDSLSAEAVRTLSDYLKINTTNPPGNELEGARFLQRILAREGIDAQILDTAELGAGRANLYARLRGDGTKRAIALVNHLDVVPADRRYWTVEPFS